MLFLQKTWCGIGLTVPHLCLSFFLYLRLFDHTDFLYRTSDLGTEVQGLRVWKDALTDELVKLDPRAIQRVAIAIADSMNDQ